jgi:hypothetical protein
MIFLILLILLGFLYFYSISFGVLNKSKNSIGKNIFIMISYIFIFDFFGKYDFRYIFFEFFYVILINMILVNLFISIFYDSYKNVKAKLFFPEEYFDVKKVLFFCCYRYNRKRKNISNENIANEIEIFYKKTKINPMFANNEFNTINDFINYELDNINYIKDICNYIENTSNFMDISKITKGLGPNEFKSDKYNDIDEESYNINTYSNLSIYMNLLDMLEKDIFNLKETKHKLGFNLISKRDWRILEKEKRQQIELKKKIRNLEKKFSIIISDIENLRLIKKKVKSILENNKDISLANALDLDKKIENDKTNIVNDLEIKKLLEESMIIRKNIKNQQKSIIEENQNLNISIEKKDEDEEEDNYNNHNQNLKKNKVNFIEDDIIEEEKSGVLNKSAKDESEKINILKDDNSRDIDNLEREIDKVNLNLNVMENDNLKNSMKSEKV